MARKFEQNDEEWRRQLSAEQYRILRQKGTEMAFTGSYWKVKEKGVYRCAGCGNALFDSETKYDSGSGWPSFWMPLSKERVVDELDQSMGMIRTEVTCGTCGSHLGHLFPDGPQPTGMRYCINSAALTLDVDKDTD